MLIKNSYKDLTRFILILLLAVFMLAACQPTPNTQVIKGQGSEELESKLSAQPLAPYTYEAPEKIEDSIQLNTCTFYIKAPIEVSDSQAHPVYTLQNREFSKSDVEKICSLLVPDIVSMRDGSKATKEEIEEQITILKRGIPQYNEDGSVTYVPNELADRSLPLCYEELKTAPEEVFTPVSGTIDYTPPFDKILLCSDGSKASCSAFTNSITVFPDDLGIVQKQDWIIREGGWEGEGPVHLSPTLTEDAAKQTGNDLMAKLNLSNMQLTSIEAARMLDHYDTLSIGWLLVFTSDEGKGVPFDSNSVSTSFMQFEDDAAYAPYWPQETVSVYLDESGVRFFNWSYPCSKVDEVNSNVGLLPFSDIYKRAAELIKQGFAWTDGPGKINENYYINRILLTNCIVRKKDDTQTAYWMPTWVFIYQQESTPDNSVTPGYIAVNAIDGSRVELYGQSKED